MILNDATFVRVASMTGYEKSQYRGATCQPYTSQPAVKFFVYDGTHTNASRGQFVYVTEFFEIIRRDDYRWCQCVGDGPIEWKTLPK